MAAATRSPACSRPWPRPTASPSIPHCPETEAFSGNDTLSHNDTPVPEPGGRTRSSSRASILDFGDVTFGDKTNTATDGRVVIDAATPATSTTPTSTVGKQDGDGNTGANTGDILRR